MGNRLTLYPNVLRLLAQRHAVALARAHALWDEAAAQSGAPVRLTPKDTPEWDRVMSGFLNALRQKREASARSFQRPQSGGTQVPPLGD